MSNPTEQRPSSVPAVEQSETGIHICGACGCTMVQPVEWNQLSSRCWQILLRCPGCEWSGTGVFTGDEVEAYDEQLERGTDELLADLHALGLARLEADIEQFSAALAADLIRPEDF
jgi:hypothetical protein